MTLGWIILASLIGAGLGFRFARARALETERRLEDRIAELRRQLSAERSQVETLSGAWRAIATDDLSRLARLGGASRSEASGDEAPAPEVPAVVRELDAFGDRLLTSYEQQIAAATAWANRLSSSIEAARAALQSLESQAATSRRLDKQSRDLDQTASAATQTLHDLRAHVAESRERVIETSELIVKARSEAERGYRAVHEALDEIEGTRKLSGALRVRMEELGRRIASIDRIVIVMTSVSQKTKLLALNASITAAQSGEAGQGFGVVAQEIKVFAKQTAASVEEIVRQIHALQTETRRVSDELAENTVAVDRGLQVALRAGDALGEIRESNRSAQRKIQGHVRSLDEHLQGLSQALQASQTLSDLAKRMSAAASELQAVEAIDSSLRNMVTQATGASMPAPPSALEGLNATWAREQLLRCVGAVTSLVVGLSERARAAEQSEARALAAESQLRQAADTARHTSEAIGKIARMSQHSNTHTS
jgi:methyl-accepting chemotaxis protein